MIVVFFLNFSVTILGFFHFCGKMVNWGEKRVSGVEVFDMYFAQERSKRNAIILILCNVIYSVHINKFIKNQIYKCIEIMKQKRIFVLDYIFTLRLHFSVVLYIFFFYIHKHFSNKEWIIKWLRVDKVDFFSSEWIMRTQVYMERIFTCKAKYILTLKQYLLSTNRSKCRILHMRYSLLYKKYMHQHPGPIKILQSCKRY